MRSLTRKTKKIGCRKEIKDHEYRVGLTPNTVLAYVCDGHQVYVQKRAGLGSSLTYQEYLKDGAIVLDTAEEVWHISEMIVKVKEPLALEYPFMKEGQLVFTYFHFASNESLTNACLERGILALAYETVEVGRTLPLLKPMSEVAGRMSSLVGAFYLAKPQGGRGVLPMGATGVAPAEVLVLGGGFVGSNAAQTAAGLGAKVTILDVDLNRLERLREFMPANVTGLFNDPAQLENSIKTADVVIGAVLIPGAKAPKLLTKNHLKLMVPGSVLVDVAIDQGGCFETSRPTTHSQPTYEVDGIVHYCVANMPGAYSRTSTFALNDATLGYGLKLAIFGPKRACLENESLGFGLNMWKGVITYRAVAEAFGLTHLYQPICEVLL
jgi:alanine dehydrogenase